MNNDIFNGDSSNDPYISIVDDNNLLSISLNKNTPTIDKECIFTFMKIEYPARFIISQPNNHTIIFLTIGSTTVNKDIGVCPNANTLHDIIPLITQEMFLYVKEHLH